jgi:DNA-binding response OmpR family regulator
MKPTRAILLVDDDESYRAILRHHLEQLGYEILEAEDGTQACRIASHEPLQLVILDIIMPNMEGLETISRLRRGGIRTKILAISAAGKAPEYLEVAVLMGADAKIEKTRPIPEVVTVVQSLAEDTSPVTSSSAL